MAEENAVAAPAVDPQDPLAGGKEVTTPWVSFGKVGDFIKGTLTSVKEVPNKLSKDPNARQKQYELKAKLGSYHEGHKDETTGNYVVEEDSTMVEAGEFYFVGGKTSMDKGMRRIKIGQVVGIQFVKSLPSNVPGNNPAKIFKVIAFEMDEEWLGENAEDLMSDEDRVRTAGL